MPERRFRFGVQICDAASGVEWAAKARRAEELGFDILHIADHLVDVLAPLPSLVAAASATETLRIGTFVLNNDFRHPAVLAREALTVDLVSGGRFELGLGAGHMQFEYDQVGLPFDPGGVRVSRLEEAVPIIRRLLAGESVTVDGDHYRITDHTAHPGPSQAPHLPILVGGNGMRVHELAAREADIVGFVGFTHRQGGAGVDLADFGAEALDRQVAHVRDVAGDRFDNVELNALLQRVEVTSDREAAARAWSDRLPADQILASPYVLIGTVDEMVDELQRRRDRFGLSYFVCFEAAMEPLAPVVARLAGN